MNEQRAKHRQSAYKDWQVVSAARSPNTPSWPHTWPWRLLMVRQSPRSLHFCITSTRESVLPLTRKLKVGSHRELSHAPVRIGDLGLRMFDSHFYFGIPCLEIQSVNDRHSACGPYRSTPLISRTRETSWCGSHNTKETQEPQMSSVEQKLFFNLAWGLGTENVRPLLHIIPFGQK